MKILCVGEGHLMLHAMRRFEHQQLDVRMITRSSTLRRTHPDKCHNTTDLIAATRTADLILWFTDNHSARKYPVSRALLATVPGRGVGLVHEALDAIDTLRRQFCNARADVFSLNIRRDTVTLDLRPDQYARWDTVIDALHSPVRHSLATPSPALNVISGPWSQLPEPGKKRAPMLAERR
jgi:hypothetical protein